MTESSKSKILLASITCVSRLGIDNVVARDIIEAAGVSRSTFYQYFGDVEDAFAEMWATFGPDWFVSLLETNRHCTPIGDLDWAMVDVLSTCVRKSALHELVTRDVGEWWRQKKRHSNSVIVRDTSIISLHLGYILASSIMPTPAYVPLMLELLHAMPDNAVDILGIPKGGLARIRYPQVQCPIQTDDDPTTDALVKASVDVISSAGVASASALRICRLSRVTTGSFNSRFLGLDELIEWGFDFATEAIVYQNTHERVFETEVSAPDLNALVMANSLSSARTRWRRYKQEIHLALRHNSALLEMVKQASVRSNQILLDRFMSFGEPRAVAEGAVEMSQVFSLGQSVLFEIGIPINRLDLRILNRWFYQARSEAVEQYAS